MPDHPPTRAASDSPELSDDLAAFEMQLGQFRPTGATVNREQLLFEAGRTAALAEIAAQSDVRRNAVSRVLRVWQSSAIVMTAVSLALTTALLVRNPQTPVIIVERQSSSTGAESPRDIEVAPETPKQRFPRQEPPSTQVAISNSAIGDSVEQQPSQPTSRFDEILSRELAMKDGVEFKQDPANTVSPTSELPASVPQEPPLSPRSMMGNQARQTIDRLMKDSTL